MISEPPVHDRTLAPEGADPVHALEPDAEHRLPRGAGQVAASGSLVEALCRLCRLGASPAEPRAVLLEAARTVARALPDARGVSIGLGAPDEPIAVASTGALASSLDGRQLQAGQGPSHEAWRSRRTVTSTDLGADPRWHHLAVAGSACDPCPAVAVPLVDQAGAVGVLTCYLGEPADDPAGRSAEALASALVGLVRTLELREQLRGTAAQLQEALVSRAVIDQAKGVVMVDRHCTPDEAFRYLAELSQHRNVKLRDIAAEVVVAASARTR